MRTRLVLLIVLWCFTMPHLGAQPRVTDPGKLIVFLKDGGSANGLLMQTTGDSLLLLTNTGSEWISFSKLKTAILSRKSRPGQGLGYGVILGTYASVLLIATEGRDEADSFLNSAWFGSGLGVVISALPGMLVGGGIGYLVDSGSSGEDVVFDFSGTDDSRVQALEQLRGIGSPDKEPEVHLSIHGGSISSRAAEFMKSSYGYWGPNRSSFNWMRRAEITFSALPKLNMGAALVWFGEPKESGSWFSNSALNVSEYGEKRQDLEALGYFLVAQYRPFLGSLATRWDVLIGGGIGIASLRYQLDYTWTQNTYDPVTFQYTTSSANGTQKISESSLTGILTADINYHIYRGLSLGFSVDHVFGPARNLEGAEQAGVPARTIKFGNTSIGFGIGLHF